MRKIALVFLISLVLASCTQENPEVYEVKAIELPAGEAASLPALFSGSDLLISWVSKPSDSLAVLSYARLKDGKWTSPEEITQGQNWFVNWADFPAIVENKGSLLSHILQKSAPATFSYDVKLSVLPRGEASWTNGLSLHSDTTQTEHGFVSAMAYTDSSFFVSWLDGRNTGGGGHGHSGHGAGAMSIRAAAVGLDGRILWDELLDAKTCDCCQTSSALTDLGPVVVYRNRSDKEIRDIAITRLVNGKWTEPSIIHPDGWEIAGCPVNGPKVAAKGKTLLVGWFTAADAKPKVNFAFSGDAGATFSKPIQVDSAGIIGRVDVALLDDWSGIASWMESKGEQTHLKAVRVDRDGKMGVPISITTLDPSRKSGFPQLEIHGDRVYFAWTEVGGESSRVRTAFLPKEAF
jgi:hypothetical protein